MKKKEFSKVLLIQESILIWIMSIAFLILAFFCIWQQYLGTLPWLAAMVGFPWTAYGVSQMCYYKKSMAENTVGGIKFESVLQDIQNMTADLQDGYDDSYEDFSGINTENPDDYII